MDAIHEKFLGAWRLIECTTESSAGEKRPGIWGTELDGLIIYLPNNIMSVHVTKKGRTAFQKDDFRGGSLEEIKEAFESYAAYFGRYELTIEESRITHLVEGSLFPNWIGKQERYYEFEKDILTLRTPPIFVGSEESISSLVWKKIP